MRIRRFSGTSQDNLACYKESLGIVQMKATFRKREANTVSPASRADLNYDQA